MGVRRSAHCHHHLGGDGVNETWRQLSDRYGKSIEEVKAQLPLEWVVTVPAGVHLVATGDGRSSGLCPFHADANPSLDVFGYGERWGCFPCDRGGDLFDFIGDYWELTGFAARFEKAIQLLEQFQSEGGTWEGVVDRAGPVRKVTPQEIAPEIQAAWDTIKRQTTKPVIDLLERKGISDIDPKWLIDTWRLGISPQMDVLAPYYNREDLLVSYKTRSPKRGGWFARKGASLTALYGEWMSTGPMAESHVWLCEGETDTWLASWLMRGRGIALGLPAGAGSRISDEWVDLLRDRRVTLVMDADKAGRNAAVRWWEHLNAVCREVLISFPDSDLCDSKDPLAVLEGGSVVTTTAGFVVARADNKAYQKITQNGAGEVLSNFVFEPTKRITYMDSLGKPVVDGYEGHFADQSSRIVRIKSTDFATAADMRSWAIEHGRSWYDSSPKYTMSLLDQLQSQKPFLKEEIAVPVAGLWGWETGNPVFVLPRGSGGSIGSAIAREKWSFYEGGSKYDIGGRYLLQDRGQMDVAVIRALHKLNDPGVTTPLIAWMAVAPLRAMAREFPPMAVLGGSGSGKTSMTLAVMKLFWGWQGAEQNLTNTTPYAVKQASAAANGLPMWWDEYRHGARRDTFAAVGQVIRDSWTMGVSTRGGVGEDLSRIEQTAAVAPLLLSGEAGLEERSHQDRVVVVSLSKGGRNAEALQVVMDDVQGTGGGVLGRMLIEWEMEQIDRGNLLLVAGAPRMMDRQEQGLSVLRWGWAIWREFLRDRFGIKLEWDLDLGVVQAEREGLDDFPEVGALWEAIQSGAKEPRSGDMVPVAWIEDEALDIVCVRSRAFYRWAVDGAGFVLPGGERATNQLLKNHYTLLEDGEVAYTVSYPQIVERRRGYRLKGVIQQAAAAGVTLKRMGPGV